MKIKDPGKNFLRKVKTSLPKRVFTAITDNVQELSKIIGDNITKFTSEKFYENPSWAYGSKNEDKLSFEEKSFDFSPIALKKRLKHLVKAISKANAIDKKLEGNLPKEIADSLREDKKIYVESLQRCHSLYSEFSKGFPDLRHERYKKDDEDIVKYYSEDQETLEFVRALDFIGISLTKDEVSGKYSYNEITTQENHKGIQFEKDGQPEYFKLGKDEVQTFLDSYLNASSGNRPQITIDALFKYYVERAKDSIETKGFSSDIKAEINKKFAEYSRTYSSKGIDWKIESEFSDDKVIYDAKRLAVANIYRNNFANQNIEANEGYLIDEKLLETADARPGVDSSLIEKLKGDMSAAYDRYNSDLKDYDTTISSFEAKYIDQIKSFENQLKTASEENKIIINEQLDKVKKSFTNCLIIKNLYAEITKNVSLGRGYDSEELPKFVKYGLLGYDFLEGNFISIENGDINVKDFKIDGLIKENVKSGYSAETLKKWLEEIKVSTQTEVEEKLNGTNKTPSPAQEHEEEPQTPPTQPEDPSVEIEVDKYPNVLRYVVNNDKYKSSFVDYANLDSSTYLMMADLFDGKDGEKLSLVDLFNQYHELNPDKTFENFIDENNLFSGRDASDGFFTKKALIAAAEYAGLVDGKADEKINNIIENVDNASYVTDLVAKEIFDSEELRNQFENSTIEERQKMVDEIISKKNPDFEKIPATDKQQAFNRWGTRFVDIRAQERNKEIQEKFKGNPNFQKAFQNYAVIAKKDREAKEKNLNPKVSEISDQTIVRKPKTKEVEKPQTEGNNGAGAPKRDYPDFYSMSGLNFDPADSLDFLQSLLSNLQELQQELAAEQSKREAEAERNNPPEHENSNPKTETPKPASGTEPPKTNPPEKTNENTSPQTDEQNENQGEKWDDLTNLSWYQISKCIGRNIESFASENHLDDINIDRVPPQLAIKLEEVNSFGQVAVLLQEQNKHADEFRKIFELYSKQEQGRGEEIKAIKEELINEIGQNEKEKSDLQNQIDNFEELCKCLGEENITNLLQGSEKGNISENLSKLGPNIQASLKKTTGIEGYNLDYLKVLEDELEM